MPRSSPGASVEADWFACLPEDKLQAFNLYTDALEARYLLLTVSLSKAMALRSAAFSARDSTANPQQVVATTRSLCEILANRLQGMLSSMEEHAMLYNVFPNIAPLDPANFRGRFGRRTARLAALFSRFLLSPRTRFLRKVRTLREMIGYIAGDFCNAARAAAEASPQLPSTWEKMDAGHFDLNTCLRETTILLKSFLRALPEEQLPYFQQNVECRVTKSEPASRAASVSSSAR